jgi:hypothetical protein
MNGYEMISWRATFNHGIRFIQGWRCVCIDRSIDQTLLVPVLVQVQVQLVVS